MGIANFASRHTGQDFTVADLAGVLTVASGEPVQVFGIHFTSDTTSIFTVTDGSDTALFTVRLEAATSYNLQTCWLADAGIKVQNSVGDGSCMVFHNSPGN